MTIRPEVLLAILAMALAPAFTRAVLIARCSTASSTWCRRTIPLRGSTDGAAAGNRYCQPSSRPAFGYLRFF